MERPWKLGEDLYPEDNLLDGISFDELITTVRCNCRTITQQAVMQEFETILSIRLEDARFLLRNNLSAIMQTAGKERENA